MIAGPNGAGKTTFAREFLPKFADCPKFVNVDLIAGGLSPFAPERAALQAGRLMLQQINEYSHKKESFGFETTLSGKSYLSFFDRLRKSGYEIYLFFLWLPSVEMAIQRVKDRVKHGGHFVKDEDVRRRLHRGLANFRFYRSHVNQWIVFDSSSKPPTTLGYGDSIGYAFQNTQAFKVLKSLLGDL